MAKNLKIVEWKKEGEFSKEAKDFEEVLDQCASLMDDACTWEVFGTPVFKAENGKLYTVELQAKIIRADKDMIDHAQGNADE